MEAAMRRTPPADFTAATWNVYHGSPVAQLRPVLRLLRADGVTLFLMQEVSNPDVRVMLHEEGLEVAFAPHQYAVAYDPAVWEREGVRRYNDALNAIVLRTYTVEAVRLGSTRWFSTTGAPQWSEAVRVILRHKPSGLTVDALSYHTPAGVQRGGPAIDSVPRRIAVLRESMATLTRLANEGRADAVLYGGDDNVDERHGTGWDFMLPAATGLRQVVAPEGTHGPRKIDDFRVRGLTPMAGRVVENVSDHDIHVRAFRFADRKEPVVASTPKTDALVAALRRRGVEVLTHDQWGSQHAATYRQRLTSRPHALLPDKPVDTLWNHVTVTFDSGRLLGDFKADMRTIERIGMERFKSGFSYNFGVDANGDRPRIGLGQFLEAKGTHTVNDKKVALFSRDQNAVALAVAWVGMPGNKLNKHALEAMVQLRGALIEVGALTATYDDVPHSLVAFKDCPTDELRNRLPELKRLGLAAAKPRAVEPTRISRARLLLDAAHARAVKLGHTKRAAAIKAARDLLPKR
jgi:hypothetical protein